MVAETVRRVQKLHRLADSLQREATLLLDRARWVQESVYRIRRHMQARELTPEEQAATDALAAEWDAIKAAALQKLDRAVKLNEEATYLLGEGM